MYKFANAENTLVDNIETGELGIHKLSRQWPEYQEWLSNGGVTLPWKSDEELLRDAMQAKIAEIDAAIQVAESYPVYVGGHAFRGGFQSGMALDAARRMMVEYTVANPMAGITTVDFFDINGSTITLPLNSETDLDALDVCLAVGQAAAANSFKCAELIAAVKKASTIEEVNAIHW